MNSLNNEQKNISMRKLSLDEMAEINGGITAKQAVCVIGMGGVGTSFGLVATFAIPGIGGAIAAAYIIGGISAIGSELVCSGA